MKKQNPYETLLLLLTALVIIYLFSRQAALLWFGVGLSIVCLLSPFLALKVHQAWLWLAKILGVISGTVLLALVYALFVLPISLFIGKKLSINRSTGFRVRNHIYQKKDLENPW